jgi:VWFA-related protein
MRRAALQSGILLAALSGYATAQTGSVPDAAQPTLHTTTTLVVIPALVQTPAQNLVFSLTADDFTLTDNGVPQKITVESDTAPPLSLVVLMQTGGAARAQFGSYSHLDTMLAAILGNSHDKVSIVNFDSRPEAASPFTSDIAQWRDAIDQPDPGDSGAAIFDGLSYALNLLKQQPPNTRRAILLLSQEHDNGSKATLEDIARTAAETNTAIYSVTFSAEKTTFKQALKGSSPVSHPPIVVNRAAGPFLGYFNLGAPLGLALGAMRKNTSEELSGLSGGESSSFDNRAELDQDLGILNNHIRNSYILNFYPYPTSGKPGLHAIRVALPRHPELLVTARGSYWSVAADSGNTGAARP